MPDPAHASDRYEGLPADWSESVAETYVQIEDERDLDAASTAALFEACALLALADQMQAQVAADGLMVAGSAGQPVPNGLLTEIRLARSAAIGTLRALGVAPAQNAASAAGAALAAKRHHGRTPGVRMAR
jgi:hypothetical protein